MQRIGASPDDIVRITTDRGHSLLGRLAPADAADTGILRLDRFARQTETGYAEDLIQSLGMLSENGENQLRKVVQGVRVVVTNTPAQNAA